MPKQGLMDKARAQNFHFTDNKGGDFVSQTKQQFGNLGDPNAIKAVLDNERKQDLRSHHFTYGSLKENWQKPDSNPHGHPDAKPSGAIAPRKAQDSIFGKNAKGDYKTSN